MATIYFDPKCKKKDLAQQRVLLYYSLEKDKEGFEEISKELGISQDRRVFYAKGDLVIFNQRKPSVIISEDAHVARSLLSDLEELTEIKLRELNGKH